MSKNDIYISCNAIVSNDNWSISYLYKGKIFAISLERLTRIKEFPDKYFSDRLPSYQKELFNGIDKYSKEYEKILSFRNYVDKLINDTLKRKINFIEVNNIYLMNFPFDISINGFENKVISKKMNYHHLFHACSAFFPSEYEESAILCMDHDGCDEELNGVNPMHSIWYAKNNKIDFLYSDNFDTNKNSAGIGTVYHLHSQICGLKEGTFMGLSGYGKNNLDNVKIFDYSSGGPLISESFFNKGKIYKGGIDSYDIEYDKEIGLEKDLIKNFRKAYKIENYKSDNLVDSKFADIADKVQKETEEAIVYLANKAYNLTKSKKLCIAGGVGLNILANTKILEKTPFEEVFVQPACGDDGLSLGGLYYLYHIINKNKNRVKLENPGLGFDYSDSSILLELEKYSDKIEFKKIKNKSSEISHFLNDDKVIGWFSGGSEFGPRALGFRSILSSPCSTLIRDKVNDIKSRERFRPLAPIILEEDINIYLETKIKSPYMTFVGKTRKEYLNKLSGVTHIDGTARYQTVSEKENKEIYDLLQLYKEKSGVGVLINTSFNAAGEPIIESPREAIEMFLSTNIDHLVIGNYLVSKNEIYIDYKFNKDLVLNKYNNELESNILTDLRIVNTCSNNCLYCLEQSYREKQKYIDKSELFKILNNSNVGENINFYGGNPLLHPDLEYIINFSKSKFKNIGLLTNTFSLTESKLNNLKFNGLNSIGFYFNSFDKNNHNLINGNGISLKELLKNIELIKKSGLFYKAIIHINLLNINNLYKDVLILNSKFGVKNIEFVNYFPFDRPYENKDNLEYNIEDNKGSIALLFKIIKKLNIHARFIKFDKRFFGKDLKYYNFQNGILDQIGEEDIERLTGEKEPFCYTEDRCEHCFIRDKCNYYGV